MALLDALLAFVLTLAALATVVTVVMEIINRVLRLKAKKQIRVIQFLYKDVIAPLIGSDPSDAAQSAGAAGASQNEDQKMVLSGVLGNPTRKQGETASTSTPSEFGQRLAAIYDNISLEHFLRRVLEVPGVKEALQNGPGADEQSAEAPVDEQRKNNLEKGLRVLSTKYDEYASAVATHFQRRARAWSLGVGIVLAVGMNIDGMRLFGSYLVRPELANKATLSLQPREAPSAKAAQRTAKVRTYVIPASREVSGLATEPAAGGESNPDGALQAELSAKIAQVNEQLALFSDLGLPVGSAYFPYCVAEYDRAKRVAPTDRQCDPNLSTIENIATLDGGIWLLSVLVTGLLIGLGAPFWYDVARRVGQVRLFFGANGSAEQRHRGSDATKDTEARKKLITQIVEDVT